MSRKKFTTSRSPVNDRPYMPSSPDAIVLCGGAGSRLRTITGNAPKVMATIGGRPFLEILLRQLSRHGFRRVVLAVADHQHAIREYFGLRAFCLDLAYSPESTALGTGGSVRNALNLVESDDALIMNGDSYTEVDFHSFLLDYRNAGADVSVAVVAADGREDCGSVVADRDYKVTRFEEKQNRFQPHYINAGIYLVSRHIHFYVEPGLPVSLEAELLPRWLREGRHIRAFRCSGRCTDIGTPERYRSAQHILANVELTGC